MAALWNLPASQRSKSIAEISMLHSSLFTNTWNGEPQLGGLRRRLSYVYKCCLSETYHAYNLSIHDFANIFCCRGTSRVVPAFD
jgi:hypothetical protein